MILDAKGKPFLTEEERAELFRKQEEEELRRFHEGRWEQWAAYCFEVNRREH